MSSNDNSETNDKANKKSSVIKRDDENSFETQKVENRFTDSPEAKENVKKASKIATKQSKQGMEDKHKRHVYPLVEHKEQSNTTNKTQQSNLHVRYWTYLFDNLHRSIDEIFCACESEENVSGCHVCVIKLHYFNYAFVMLENIRCLKLWGDKPYRIKMLWGNYWGNLINIYMIN